ncbi:Magnesium transporter MgtE [Candidatus Portiera aleyrodidarum]|uniref:magnesium transporter n=1 Tax=Candidatus Portiera aleyrodidarum TaxID=91844 RepID=UPI0005D7DD26|nr:magnesium transporter [Candidatus Portiera aleyrodidarum]CEL12451.1 Magnesium transporter MgtE [Candidatus Portiera aleyrodidarum]
MEINKIFPELIKALSKKDYKKIKYLLKYFRSADIADLISRKSNNFILKILNSQNLKRKADIFSYLPKDKQFEITKKLKNEEIIKLFVKMNSDDSADVFKMFEPIRRENILRSMAHKVREDIIKLSSYEDGSAGAIMTSKYVVIPEKLNVLQALNKIKQTAPDAETIYQVYVLDNNQKLTGTLSLRQILLADPIALIKDLMIKDVIYVNTNSKQEYVANLISRYDFLAIPVINSEHKLVGLITYDDAMDVVERETTDDFHKSGSVGTLEYNIVRTKLWTLYSKRVFWLVLLIFGNLFSGAGISQYEKTIYSKISLVFFLPLLIGSGGNAGSQAATLMIRGLGTGEINIKDWAKLMSRELLVSGILGLTMAVVIFPIGYIRGGIEVAYSVAGSMIIIVIIGSLLGMSLPFFLNRLGFDPAAASAPLVATLCDTLGVLIFFSIATIILNIT